MQFIDRLVDFGAGCFGGTVLSACQAGGVVGACSPYPDCEMHVQDRCHLMLWRHEFSTGLLHFGLQDNVLPHSIRHFTYYQLISVKWSSR